MIAVAVGASLTAACTTKRTVPLPPNPDVALRAAAVAREQALIAAYESAAFAHPDLADLLSRLKADHEAHLAELRPSGTPTPLAAFTRPTPVPQPPAVLAKARADLAALERTAAVEHARDCATASRSLAPLLAMLAACESSHAAVL